MYKSIIEMIGDIEEDTTKEDRIKTIQSYAKQYPQFKLFLHYAFFNEAKSSFDVIPEYKPNMVGITFSYVKLEKGLQQLKYFFQGKDFILNNKKRTDKLLSFLEEMSWLETSTFEMLILNNYKNKILTKKLVIDALPEFAEGAK